MALLSVIRRWHFRQHIPIREIERRTGLSRNTIRKYLRADTVEPKFKIPVRSSMLDPFAEKLGNRRWYLAMSCGSKLPWLPTTGSSCTSPFCNRRRSMQHEGTPVEGFVSVPSLAPERIGTARLLPDSR